jgi:hypothetical protein
MVHFAVNLGHLFGQNPAVRLPEMPALPHEAVSPASGKVPPPINPVLSPGSRKPPAFQVTSVKIDAPGTRSLDATKSSGRTEELIQLLRGRSYAEIRGRMYDSAPGSPWWAACKAELELRNGQQVAEASLGMSRVSEKMRASTQHFEQLADTLHHATQDLADLLRGTQETGRRLEIAVYVTIGITLVQLFNLIFEIFRRR